MTEEPDRVRCYEVDECEDEFVDFDVLDSYFLHAKPRRASFLEYKIRSELEKLIEENLKYTVEIATRRVITHH